MTPEETAVVKESLKTQEILDAQGFVILVDIQDRKPGEIIPIYHSGNGLSKIVLPGPLVVTGSATRAEYVDQCRRFFSQAEAPPHYDIYRYIKVVAE